MKAKTIFTGILFVVLQITLLNLLTIRGVKPDLVVLFVVARALADGPSAAVAWGFGLGILLDAVSGGLMGFASLTYSLAGFIAGQIGYGRIVTRPGFLMASAIGALVVYGLTFYFYLPWQTIGWVKPFLSVTIPGIGYTLILALIWILGPFSHFSGDNKRA
jgi:rod shape-determining protein MreD